MRTTRTRAVVLATSLGAGVMLGGCGSDDTPDTGEASPGGDGAAEFCTSNGGTVEVRQAYFGTNNDQSDWIQLPATLELCQFTADDESRIYVDTTTLAAEAPTLAAAAYLAKLPPPDDTGGANPAAVGCTETVHGTSSWGTGLSGGGWVDLDDPTFTVVNLCVFADRSAIDEWGIAYYSQDVVRGADLAELFRFDADAGTPMFPPTRR